LMFLGKNPDHLARARSRDSMCLSSIADRLGAPGPVSAGRGGGFVSFDSSLNSADTRYQSWYEKTCRFARRASPRSSCNEYGKSSSRRAVA